MRKTFIYDSLIKRLGKRVTRIEDALREMIPLNDDKISSNLKKIRRELGEEYEERLRKEDFLNKHLKQGDES